MVERPVMHRYGYRKRPDSDQNAHMATDAPPAAGDSLKILGRYHPYSWLGKVRVILPSANTVVEAEFNRWARERLTFHGARTPVAGTPSQQSLNDMADGADCAAGNLGTAECDLGKPVLNSNSATCRAVLISPH